MQYSGVMGVGGMRELVQLSAGHFQQPDIRVTSIIGIGRLVESPAARKLLFLGLKNDEREQQTTVDDSQNFGWFFLSCIISKGYLNGLR